MFVGDEIENCRDFSGVVYRRPFERVRRYDCQQDWSDEQGMLVNWDAEKVIWDRLFSPDVLKVGLSLVL